MQEMQSKKKGLGFWMLTTLVAGNMIGSGVFLLPAALASFGSISILSWIFTSTGAILIALVFAKMSSIIPKTGGPYAFCRAGFGDFVGFQVAYNYWIALWIGNAAIVVAFVGYLGVFWPALQHNDLLSFSVKVATVWLLTIVNAFGVRNAGFVQVVTTIMKLLPLILVTILGMFMMHPHNFSQFNISGHSNISAFTGAATLTFWAFIGLESATVPAEDATHPNQIALATIVGTSLAAAIYVVSTIVLIGVIPATSLMHSSAPFADAANKIFTTLGQYISPGSLGVRLGAFGQDLIAFGAIISCFGALNGWVLLQGQIPFAAARDDLFPRVFAKESRFGTPYVGLFTSAILITGLLTLTLHTALVKQFTLIILLATLASLIPYLFTCMSELLIFIRMREQFNGQRLLKSTIISILASAYAFWMIMGSGVETVFYGTLLFFSSVPVYVWMQWSHRKHLFLNAE